MTLPSQQFCLCDILFNVHDTLMKHVIVSHNERGLLTYDYLQLFLAFSNMECKNESKMAKERGRSFLSLSVLC
jgi:hypothetical protein